MKNKSYRELKRLLSFEERYEYLQLQGAVGDPTFGFDRYLNQMLYRSTEWKRVRDEIITRDYGRDLGIAGREIPGIIIVHHMNPITPEDIEESRDVVFDPNGLICTSQSTHLAIHYGDKSLLISNPVVRYPGDTTLWKKRI